MTAARPLRYGAAILATATVVAVALLATAPDRERVTPTTTEIADQPTNLPIPLSTSATVAAHPARGPAIQLTEPPVAPTTTIPLPPHHDTWLALAQCESGGDWTINTGNGFLGGLQFTLTSWRGAGGEQYATHPHHATALEQMWTAEVLLGLQGWKAWPGCSRRLGLR